MSSLSNHARETKHICLILQKHLYCWLELIFSNPRQLTWRCQIIKAPLQHPCCISTLTLAEFPHFTEPLTHYIPDKICYSVNCNMKLLEDSQDGEQKANTVHFQLSEEESDVALTTWENLEGGLCFQRRILMTTWALPNLQQTTTQVGYWKTHPTIQTPHAHTYWS